MQAIDDLGNAQHSMSHELQIALAGKISECGDDEADKDADLD